MSKNKFIPVCEPLLGEPEKQMLNQALDSGWISSAGEFIDRFESEFSAYCGVKYGISCTNGTTALHLALLAAGIGPGDEVILPDFTMVATLFAILYVGATPVFVDAEADTWNIDVSQVAAKINKNTKAILPVHIYGHPVDMDPLLELAKKHKLLVIEDAAEAHGAEYKGRKCGSLGDMACFSFYANKIITTGEGGMVVTSNKKLADRCRYYKNLCFPLDGPRNYLHHDLGYNFRMTNMQAALGVAQLSQIEDMIQRRRANAARYSSLLKEVDGITLPTEKSWAKSVYWMYGILIDQAVTGISRDELMVQLQEKGIQTRIFFQPMHQQPVLRQFNVQVNEDFPVSEKLAATGLYLPSSSGLGEDNLIYVSDQIKDIIIKQGRSKRKKVK